MEILIVSIRLQQKCSYEKYISLHSFWNPVLQERK